MAATPEVVELRHLSGRELDPLLLEETVEWQRELDWDFGRSADLVRQFADMRALTGYALVDRGEVAGYGYSVLEEQRGLMGDLYIRPPWRNGTNDVRLFRAILDGLIATPNLRRIESQLMLVDPSVGKALKRERPVKVTGTDVDEARCDRAPLPSGWSGPAPLPHRTLGRSSPRDGRQCDFPRVRRTCGQPDQRTVQTVAGARRFLYNIVQFPGCGTFFRPGSFVAFDPQSGWMAGIVLVSFVGGRCGTHHTTVCDATGAGPGTGLRTAARGHQCASYTWREANQPHRNAGEYEAIELYRRCGFQDVRRFLSYVWDAS